MDMKFRKQSGLAALLLAAVLLLSACGGGEKDPAENAPASGEPEAQEPAETPEDPAEEVPDHGKLAMEQYKEIVGRAETYDYGDFGPNKEPTGEYRYALTPMQTRHNVPALLLSQPTTFGIDYIRVFQYDPDSGTLLEPPDILMEGVGEAGGFRGNLFAAGDRNGVLSCSNSSGTGEGQTQRVTLDGGAVRMVTLWAGNVLGETDWTFEEIGTEELQWHDAGDTAALDAWTPDPDFVPREPVDETALPEDGDRIVFRGIIGLYDYETTMFLQGCPDPNAPYTDPSDMYRLLVLDVPRNMTLTSGIDEELFEAGVRVVSVPYEAVPEEYDGQHLIFSIDPNATYWPTDSGMPVAQPYTMDVHILS